MRHENRHHQLTVEKATQIMREAWDPIGCGQMEDLPSDEYASYAPKIVEILTGCEEDGDFHFASMMNAHARVAAYLAFVRVRAMGLTGEDGYTRDATGATALVAAAAPSR